MTIIIIAKRFSSAGTMAVFLQNKSLVPTAINKTRTTNYVPLIDNYVFNTLKR